MSVFAVLHGMALQGFDAAAVEPNPSPTSVEIPAADQTSPGLLGFLVTFAVALAVLGLAFAIVRQIRRVDYRAKLQAEEEATKLRDTAPERGEAGEDPR